MFDPRYFAKASNVSVLGLANYLARLSVNGAKIHLNGKDTFYLYINMEENVLSILDGPVMLESGYLTSVINVTVESFSVYLSSLVSFNDPKIRVGTSDSFYVHVNSEKSVLEISNATMVNYYQHGEDDIHIQINGSIMSIKERSIVEFCDKKSYKLESQDSCVSADNGEPV